MSNGWLVFRVTSTRKKIIIITPWSRSCSRDSKISVVNYVYAMDTADLSADGTHVLIATRLPTRNDIPRSSFWTWQERVLLFTHQVASSTKIPVQTFANRQLPKNPKCHTIQRGLLGPLFKAIIQCIKFAYHIRYKKFTNANTQIEIFQICIHYCAIMRAKNLAVKILPEPV